MSVYGNLPNDAYRPPIDKPSLGGYDPYQIHDIYCDDIEYQPLTDSNNNPIDPPDPIKFKNWLAVERISPKGVIECNFEAIAVQYP